MIGVAHNRLRFAAGKMSGKQNGKHEMSHSGRLTPVLRLSPP